MAAELIIGLPSVSVVIPTYQRRTALPAVLEPVLREPALHEAVVVVDGSTDGSADLVRHMARDEPRLKIVAIENRGISGARFAGASTATGEVILLLDDDVIALPGLVRGHARHHARARELLVVGYMPIPPTPRRPGGFAQDLYAREYERHCARWEAAPETVLRSLWAGNMSLRRADYMRLESQIDSIVHGYHEDLDFGLRCLGIGLSGRFDRALAARHRYVRDPAGFVRDARSSGTNLARLHRVHGRTLGSLRSDFAIQGLAAPARWLVVAARRHRWPRRCLELWLPALGRLRLFKLERYVASLVWRIEQQRGACC